ncbi:hypothetical protein P43SY_000865 [Pythium insidiosum]|uniref:DDE Tnp4 domain-containing protein n=1 Tax=Pythium insidiosum TaxID=114742 RepID=A0AAD5LMS6_PYTIN|nr:hypothetical protein P43SY_000865 [Pythium insidiosum]
MNADLIELLRFDKNGTLMAHLLATEISKNLRDAIPVPMVEFDIREWHPAKSKHRFRLSPSEIIRLHACLCLPDIIYSAQRHPTVLCSIFLQTVDLIHDKVKQRMNFDHAMLNRYSAEVAENICECTGMLYNGHKRVHALKFQMVVMSNGLIVSLTGPVEGRRHDVALLNMSNIASHMKEHFPGYCLYGDPAYPIKSWLVAPFKGSSLTRRQERFNSSMSSMRVSVEWMFGAIVSLWKFLDFSSNQKVLLSPVGKLFILGGFLTNCVFCIRGKNQATAKFGTRLPTLEEYIE